MATYRDSTAGVHRTLTFSLDRSMDDDEASDALVRLGVGIPRSPSSADPGRRWLSCCLRSDGVVELWRTPGSDTGRGSADGDGSAGSPVSKLDAAGLPYVET